VEFLNVLARTLQIAFQVVEGGVCCNMLVHLAVCCYTLPYVATCCPPPMVCEAKCGTPEQIIGIHTNGPMELLNVLATTLQIIIQVVGGAVCCLTSFLHSHNTNPATSSL